MVMDPKEQERILADWPVPAPDRPNINQYVHVGDAIQKPYASVEHLLARKVSGWHSFEQLAAAVKAAYPEGLSGEIEQTENGEVFRWIQEGTGSPPVAGKDGTLLMPIRRVKRWVAYSQADAKAASAAGRPTDYFNGFTWVRNGVKQERDGATMAAQPGANPNVEYDYVPANEHDQLAYAAQINAATVRQPVLNAPTVAAAAPKADSKSKGAN
jgi:hypothetical protein